MKKYKRLPDSELEAMLIIWQNGKSIPTGEILQKLSRSKPCSLQVVQSTLNRLLDKGFVKCEKIGRLNYYSPLADYEEYRTQEAASFVERLYDNSPSKLFATLLRGNSISSEDLEEMKKILEEGGGK